MKTSDRTILMALVGIGLLAAFWMLVISPKRDELADLGAKADELQSSVAALEAEARAGEAARDSFPVHYERMVVLGKAVPSAAHEEADLIVGLDRIGADADVSFRSIELTEGAAPPPQPATAETQTDQNQDAEAEAAASAPVPTETVASTLPLGASIGPAGLGVMSWNLQFSGDFFDLNAVLAAIDRSVSFKGNHSNARGRLVTVDGFSLTRADADRVPELAANLAIRTYVMPKDEGVTLGATPAGPATTPVSAEVTP